MIVQRSQGLGRLLVCAQAALVTALYWGLFAACRWGLAPGVGPFAWHYALAWALVLACLVFEMLTRGGQRRLAPLHESSLVPQLPVASRQVVFALGGALAGIAFFKDFTVSRGFLAGFAVLLYGALLWSNATLPRRLARLLFTHERDLATLLIGPVSRVGMLEHWLKRKREFGLRIVGVITPAAGEGSDGRNHPSSALGSFAQFEEMCEAEKVSQVILLELGAPEFTRAVLGKCQQRGIRLLIVNDLAEKIHHPITCYVDEGINLITPHEEPLENPLNRVVKRVFDLALAVVALVCVLPWLTVLVWVCHRWQSPGPLWHRQWRAGLQNRPFEIWKFRTMHFAPEKDVAEPATPGDPRVFPAGRWLRRFSLDEMPQFLNVLGGEMSVVGPRPHLVEHNRQFAEIIAQYHLRTLIKPGITGLAQVRGFRGEARTPEDIAARLQSDLVYLENWSLALDGGILLRTLWQMLRPPATAI